MEVKGPWAIIIVGDPEVSPMRLCLSFRVFRQTLAGAVVDLNSNHYARHHRLTPNNHVTNN